MVPMVPVAGSGSVPEPPCIFNLGKLPAISQEKSGEKSGKPLVESCRGTSGEVLGGLCRPQHQATWDFATGVAGTGSLPFFFFSISSLYFSVVFCFVLFFPCFLTFRVFFFSFFTLCSFFCILPFIFAFRFQQSNIGRHRLETPLRNPEQLPKNSFQIVQPLVA